MYSLNRAQIVGNVTRDVEMRYTPNGQAVCSFSVATNRRWRDKEGNNQEQTEFHNVVAWGKVAEIISQYVKKGHKIYIEGRLQTRNWEGQDGTKRNRTEIVMEDFVFLTPKGANSTEPSPDLGEEVEEINPKKTTKNKEESPAKTDSKTDVDEDEINLDEIPF